MATVPNQVIIFSGKRKSGKDYITDRLKERFGEDKCSILRLSGPLKFQYAKEHGLDYEKLLDASDYKEKYRADMIRWGEDRRNKDPGFFCRLIAEGPGSEKPVWIISDARRKTDIQFFQDNFRDQVITVRVQASEATRCERGWRFQKGVDDAESECGLDDYKPWDHIISNNPGETNVDKFVSEMIQNFEEHKR